MRVLLLVHFLGGFEGPVLGLSRVDGPYARELSGRVDISQSTTNRTYSRRNSLGNQQIACAAAFESGRMS